MKMRTLTYQRNFSICGREGDPYFDSVICGVPEGEFFSFVINKLTTQGSVVFDVGANIGVTAVISALATGGKVYAFEPGPSIYPYLQGTLAQNSNLDIEPVNMGLGSEAGELSYFEDPTSSASSHVITGNTIGRESTQRIPVTTLDAFVAEHDIQRLDLIKIDVEGFEIDVLRGAARTLATLKPSVLVEFNAFTMIAFRNISPREMLKFLRTTFPFVYYYDKGEMILTDTEAADLEFIHRNVSGTGCVDDLYCTFHAVAMDF